MHVGSTQRALIQCRVSSPENLDFYFVCLLGWSLDIGMNKKSPCGFSYSVKVEKNCFREKQLSFGFAVLKHFLMLLNYISVWLTWSGTW